jgi:hypothetical protein
VLEACSRAIAEQTASVVVDVIDTRSQSRTYAAVGEVRFDPHPAARFRICSADVHTAWARVLRENHRDHAGKPPPRRQHD